MLRNQKFNFKKTICFVLIGMVYSQTTIPDLAINTFIVWNVGQGQWLTWIDLKGTCFHFDMGGEYAPFQAIHRFCHKRHFYALTHTDSDHQRFLKKFRKQVQLRSLSSQQFQDHKILIFKPHPPDNTENSKSHWLIIENKILITGDSPKKVEERMVHQHLLPFEKIKIFILGHHGSKTSNSPALLKKLNKLRTAVASARWSRYGHPHPQVRSLLEKRKTPLLETEKWGHLRFQL